MCDATAAGLGLRATPAGKPAYVYQGVYQGKDIRHWRCATWIKQR